MAHNIHGTFVSEKVNKVRWRPDYFNSGHNFVTGSVENVEQNLKLWEFYENSNLEDGTDDIYPFPKASYVFDGDCSEIKFINADTFVAASTAGSVHLVRIVCDIERMANEGVKNVNESTAVELQLSKRWDNLHRFVNGEKSPCTGLATYDNDVATIGEDGAINLLTVDNVDKVQKIENADSCSLHCIIFLKHNELLTSNLRGQLKVFDVRQKAAAAAPVSTFMLSSGEQVCATSLTYHPTQRHLIVAGDILGALTTWDIRHNTYPINVLNAHEGSVTEMHFHPEHPDHLFSASTAGDLLHWCPKQEYTNATPLMLPSNEDVNVWMTADYKNVKNKLDVMTIMPNLCKSINSLDINRNRIICGCDNEAVYLINGINLY